MFSRFYEKQIYSDEFYLFKTWILQYFKILSELSDIYYSRYSSIFALKNILH